MKKQSIIILLGTILAQTAMAQSEPDTTSVQELHEVVIQAPKVIRKADMDVYHPSKSAVDYSKNGLQLTRNLMIPTLTINDALGSISAAGQAVQLRINGRIATLEQVKNLLPETIRRVEWIDNPGLKYDGATYVLNYIVANPTVGGSLMASGTQAVNTIFGWYNADLKLNFGRSQWSFGGYVKATDDINVHRNYRETFTFPDGQKLNRIEKSLGGSVDDSRGSVWLTYNYMKPDTTIFYVSLGANRKISEKERYYGLLSLDNGSPDILLDNGRLARGTTPSFSAYLEQHFAHRQILAVDFNASLYLGNSRSDYIEHYPDNTEYISDIHTYIKDRNQAYALQVNYMKQWTNSRFTAGASYNANRNRSTYLNLDGAIYHQRQDNAYVFAEYYQRINKLTFTAGLGAQYTDFNFKETGQGNNSWNWRPQATITYSLNNKHKFRLNFSSWQSNPSLSQTNITPQQIDGYQWQVGNPNLKTSNSYYLRLRYSFSLPRVDGTFAIRAFSSPNAITPFMYWDNDKLITTYENSRGFQQLSFSLDPQIDVIPNWLILSGGVQYCAEHMRGTDYSLYNHNWSGNVQLMAMHWGFMLTAQYTKSSRDLFGEKIEWNEDLSLIDLKYNWKKWQFGVGMINPFGRYDQGSKLLNKWNSNTKHMRLDMRIPYISISYNLQWGHNRRGVNKLINANAEVDQSSAAVR